VSHKLVWYGAAVAATAMMATLGVFVRHVSAGNEYGIALGRFSIGLVCLTIWRASTSPPSPSVGARLAAPWAEFALPLRRMRLDRRSWPLIASGIALPVFVICYFKAVTSGPLANAAFLLYLGPLIASTLAALWLGEGFNRISVALLGCALLGTLFITEFRLPDSTDQIENLVFGSLSGLFYGLFLLFNNRKLLGEIDSLAATSTQFLIAALVMIPVVGVTGIDLQPSDLPWILAVGVIHGFLALTLVIAALAYLKTIEYGTISYGEPVIAALLGGLLYNEHISLLQGIGCGLVLVAGIVRVLIRDGGIAAAPTSY
jgi:drug/metabolite transporter (DMT)-like permease